MCTVAEKCKTNHDSENKITNYKRKCKSKKQTNGLVYLFTGAMHINKHNCKRARISPKGYFSSVDP